MRQLFSPELEQYLAFHRGIGDENTLEALEAGIQEEPFLQEFDVWRSGLVGRAWYAITEGEPLKGPDYDEGRYLGLGHPPKLNRKHTLDNALVLFKGSNVIPKIDVKPEFWQLRHKLTMARLLEALENFEDTALINISGSPRKLPFLKPTPRDYMRLEKHVAEKSTDKPNILFTLDLARYADLDDSGIISHIELLGGREKVFSFSPLIDDRPGVDRAIELALQTGIRELHFWGINTPNRYPEEDLIETAERMVAIGLHPVIDVALASIKPINQGA